MDSSQEQPSISFARYWALVCHRRWWLVVPLLLGWGAVVALTWFLPARYRSETVILVEQQKVPERYVESNVAVDFQQRLQSITQQILSRTRLLAIANSYHLYEGKSRIDPDMLVERMRKDIDIELVRSNQNQLTAFKVSYSAATPQLAQQITGELTSLFIADNLRERQQLSENTTAFLEIQMENARKDLAAQEQRLREFKGRYLGELPEQLQGNVQILAGLQSRLQSATEALNQAEQQRLYLESLASQYRTLRGGSAEGGASSSAAAAPLEQQLERLRSQVADLSTRYTPQHPDVVRLKEQIARMEKLQQSLEEESKSGKNPDSSLSAAGSPGSHAASPPVAQIESQIKANQLEIANRKREIKSLEMESRQYEGRLNLTPVREQQLAAITRDYQQSRANYESLLAKKQQSEMATNLEKQQQGEQFRVLDPPSLPHKPYFPDRFKLSLIGIAAGCFLAVCMAILLEVVDARVYLEDDLARLTTVPVLVGIPSLSSPVELQNQSKRRWVEAAVMALILVPIPAVALLAYWKG